MADSPAPGALPDHPPRLADRYAAWRAGHGRKATGFTLQPEPRSIGMIARGRQLVAGNFLLGGALIEAPGKSLWEIAPPSPHFTEAAQGFVWLDDLAAAGDGPARVKAQDWTFDWIQRYGAGRGAGWTPGLTGRRLIRWINHAIMLLTGRRPDDEQIYFAALSRQARYLERRWKTAPQGLQRFEALTGLITAGLTLTEMGRLVEPGLAALSTELRAEIDGDGGISSRNPEELLEVFTLLTWISQALAEAGRKPPEDLRGVIERMAPRLRALRHADGGLARFHSGGRGLDGRLDHALAHSGVKPAASTGLSMGYARLSGGRSSAIIDATSPPGGRAAHHAHASTLAFELTSGRRPVIVSCGSGLPFGGDWARAGRATASHSTLGIEGYSSSRLGQGELLTDRADTTVPRLTTGPEGQAFYGAHSGWSKTHGLTHQRTLELSHDGRALIGFDRLGATHAVERQRLEAVLANNRLAGIAFTLRFHLHPEVDAEVDLGGTAVSLGLRSGEIWVFRPAGDVKLGLEPSVYLEKGRLKPRASKQIVLSARLDDYAAEVGWTLAKAQDTPLAIRDLERDEPPV